MLRGRGCRARAGSRPGHRGWHRPVPSRTKSRFLSLCTGNAALAGQGPWAQGLFPYLFQGVPQTWRSVGMAQGRVKRWLISLTCKIHSAQNWECELGIGGA